MLGEVEARMLGVEVLVVGGRSTGGSGDGSGEGEDIGVGK